MCVYCGNDSPPYCIVHHTEYGIFTQVHVYIQEKRLTAFRTGFLNNEESESCLLYVKHLLVHLFIPTKYESDEE